MFENLSSFFGKPEPKADPLIAHSLENSSALHRKDEPRRQTFSKVFRWRLPAGQTAEPGSVEVVGSFTDWQPVALVRDRVLDAWHVSLREIQGNKTHHYMLLVDGEPTLDRTCDGLALPGGPEEERYQLMTEKGGRVMMLFAQTK